MKVKVKKESNNVYTVTFRKLTQNELVILENLIEIGELSLLESNQGEGEFFDKLNSACIKASS